MKNNILILGGTGKTGRRIVQRLTNKDLNIRIGSRGANPRFDWDDSTTWSGALDGMDTVYITYQPDLAVPGALKSIQGLTKEAVRKGVQKLVLLSGKGEREAELCEEVIMESGLDFTIIRASWFSQNFSESFFLEPIQNGTVALPQADVKVPYVDADDIADVAVEVLLNDVHNGKIYQLTGSRFLTFREVISEIAQETGRTISFIPIRMGEYTQALKTMGVPEDYVWLIGYLFREVLGNKANQVITHDVEKVLKRKPKDFSKYLRETAATGIWNPKVEV